LADLLSNEQPDLKPRKIFDQFCERERLGCTGLGDGIAIPHCRVEGLEEPLAAIVTTDSSVDYDSPDEKPVDLAIGLIVPAEASDTHLQILAEIAKLFSNAAFSARIRDCEAPQQLLALIQHESPPSE